jgi:hypothetical protein
MRRFRKRSTPITLIGNDEIYFVLQGGSGEGQILDPLTFDRVLADEADLSAIPETFHHQAHSVMVVPDYWLESLSFPFQSTKRSLAEAFLERKLRADFPEIPEVKDFYEYFFHQTDDSETAVYAYFLRDPTFFRLYDQLLRWNLHPRRITTPAFLWASQLKERIPEFHKGGNAFVHVLSNECFLYFFFDRHFLFSRQITLPEFQGDISDQVETLTYETNQSLYLFSQKAKAEVDRIWMASFGHVEADDLSEKLGRQVEEVAGLEEELANASTTLGQPGLLSGLYLPDLSQSQKFLSISHRLIEKEQQWKPVQKVGVAVGLVLLLLLVGEGVLLWQWSMPVGMETTPGGGAMANEAVVALRQYNEALDLFLTESKRPSAGKTIINLARSLPEDVWIKEMVVETEPTPGVAFTGTVSAQKPSQFRETLSEFLDGLKVHFEGARSLGLQDIDVDTHNCKAVEGGRSCAIALEFGLP